MKPEWPLQLGIYPDYWKAKRALQLQPKDGDIIFKLVIGHDGVHLLGYPYFWDFGESSNRGGAGT